MRKNASKMLNSGQKKKCFHLAVNLSIGEAQHFMVGTGKQTCLNY